MSHDPTFAHLIGATTPPELELLRDAIGDACRLLAAKATATAAPQPGETKDDLTTRVVSSSVERSAGGGARITVVFELAAGLVAQARLEIGQ